jgi:hypothetical protein
VGKTKNIYDLWTGVHETGYNGQYRIAYMILMYDTIFYNSIYHVVISYSYYIY